MLNLDQDIQAVREQSRLRALLAVSSRPGPTIQVQGRERIALASNDYLGLAAHPRIAQASGAALERWGAGAGAARLISGNIQLYDELEQELALFKEAEAALVFSTGYMANLGLLSSLAGTDDVIYSDELNHASIIDGCRLSRARVRVYAHRNLDQLESLLKQDRRARRRIIASDAVFSMDGDIAPVPDLLALAREYDAALVLDDAHGTGALGLRGKGTLEHFGIAPRPDLLLMGTMGKALGCFGAFVAGTAELREFLINHARSFIFTTALPPAVIAAAREALRILIDEPGRPARLRENAAYMRAGLKQIGFDIRRSETQIMPVLVGEAATAVAMARYLFDRGLFVLAIRPPAVPEGTSRLRITVLATHTRAHLDEALAALQEAGKKFNIIPG